MVDAQDERHLRNWEGLLGSARGLRCAAISRAVVRPDLDKHGAGPGSYERGGTAGVYREGGGSVLRCLHDAE